MQSMSDRLPLQQLPLATDINQVKKYIKDTWQTLTRSHKDLLTAAKDPKIEHEREQSWLIVVNLCLAKRRPQSH